MITIPNYVFVKYVAYLTKTGVPASSHAEYTKWLRYYLDFCDKYPVPEAINERVRLFTAKLQEKKQSLPQRQRAANAVSLYVQMENHEKPEHKNSGTSLYAKENTDYASVKQNPGTFESLVDQTQPGLQPILQNTPHNFRNIARTSSFNEAGYQERSESPEWDEVLNKMAGEIKVRHYAWTFLPENDDDLYPLRAGHDGQGAEKPAGFLTQYSVFRPFWDVRVNVIRDSGPKNKKANATS